MRRLIPLLATLVVGSWLCLSPARGDSVQGPEASALASGQPQVPVAVPPGAVPLIQDEPDTPGLPLHFRTMADPFPAHAAQPLPSRLGMDGLRASGSAQFSATQLRTVVERVGRPLVVIDLRQESHGFLAGLPVSWYALHDQVNVVRALAEVQQDERRRLDVVAADEWTTVLVVTSRSAPGTIAEGQSVTLAARPALTERELAESLGLGYFRIPATDFLPPTAENVDRFVAFAAGLPPETWLHFHCHAGDGRTTTFLAMWDMMRNAGAVSVEDIIRRQALVGPEDLFAVGTPERWTHPFAVERAAFLQRFHEYARETGPTGFIVPWSAWSTTRSPL